MVSRTTSRQLYCGRFLTGRINPSGRLPVSFPRQLKDTPSFGNFPASDTAHNVKYAEGLFMGYRHYLRPECPKPLFYFGHGLSYSQFSYDNVSVKGDSVSSTVTLNVANTGSVPGKEVVQVYVSHPGAGDWRPIRELKAFAKVFLGVGESRKISISLDESAFAEWNIEEGCWTIQQGQYGIEIGRSANDIVSRTTIYKESAQQWTGLRFDETIEAA